MLWMQSRRKHLTRSKCVLTLTAAFIDSLLPARFKGLCTMVGWRWQVTEIREPAWASTAALPLCCSSKRWPLQRKSLWPFLIVRIVCWPKKTPQTSCQGISFSAEICPLTVLFKWQIWITASVKGDIQDWKGDFVVSWVPSLANGSTV